MRPPDGSVSDDHASANLRQGFLDFTAQTPDQCPAGEANLDVEPAQEAVVDLFGSPIRHNGRVNGFPRRSGPQRRSPNLNERTRVRTLFDFPTTAPTPDVPTPPSRGPPQLPTEAQLPPADNGTAMLPGEIATGEKAKAHDILRCIRVLQALDRDGRSATAEERAVLRRFSGFGPVALSLFPDPVAGTYKTENWRELGEELRSLLTAEEYDSAKRTTFNAFYTSPTVITAIHEAIVRLGVPNTGTVLEAGCGTGNFLSLAPAGMRFIGVELDRISGRIAQALHPEQDIRIENFRETRLDDASLDGVVGNVPFSDLKMEYRGMKLSLHDFFLAKSVDALRPQGVLAAVTSHFTLEKQNGAGREYLAGRADFIGAIRLPSDAFKREGTAVVTDILFLRKRASGVPPNHADPSWLSVIPHSIEGAEVAINQYFLSHPEMVLGTWTRKDTLYGEGYSVTGTGDLAAELQAAIARLPRLPTLAPRVVEPRPPTLQAPASPERPVSEGSFFINDDRTICQWVEGEIVPVVYGGRTLRAGDTMTGKRLAALIRVRDLARRVLTSQNEGLPEAEREAARRDLNWAYDSFVLTYGPINRTVIAETAEGRTIRRMPNVVKFREDPDAMLVLSLENYDEATAKATKAAIMTRDVVGRQEPITSVRSAEEGLLVSLNERGTVDLPLIERLYRKTRQEIIAELGDLVFHDPDSEAWQTADVYLSGNVRAKLAAVLNAGPAYAPNAEALGRVQPPDILPGDIDANLGAPWIPETDVQAFAATLFSVDKDSIQIAHLAKDAVWSVQSDALAERSVAATADAGTSRANGVWLLELALNMRTPVIYDTIHTANGEERVVNQEATLAAREKQKLIKERFRGWVFADAERTERLVRVYNDRYNNLRGRSFDGSHLAFPGMNRTVTLHSHQKDAIWRGMSSGNTLLAQAVGAGKTFTMAATGMKMRQAGLIRKPMYVVPNHLLEQFGRDFLHLYPNARILIAGKEDLERSRRKHLTAKIASGDWDGIVVTHSSFERIGMSRSYQEQFLKEQIAEYEQLLCDGAGRNTTRGHRNLIKAIEKQKAAREEKLKDLAAEAKKDDGLVFDELGVDHVFVDESHYFKNLETPTKMERVAGIQTGGSERAFDLYMKARYLHERHAGHGMTFATGTPISNSMVELYTLQRYLDPEGLRSRGLDHFDAWAATFGEVVDTMEISPDGKTLRPRSRFARFTNLPELQQMFRAFADVQTADMLDLPRPRLETGKPIVVACPMSDAQRAIQEKLVERYERLRSQKVDPRVDNALNITTDGRKLAIDARMLDPSAPDCPDSKVNAMVEKIVAIWNRTAKTRGTQMIFCDMGIHPTPWGYSAYDDVIGKLIASGIPAGEIAAIGDADSDAKKQSLFERVRTGQVRVLLGSTQKMGTGTNVQKRLVALHHLDAPWKPAEVEQRDGRILRQGNENEEVAIYRYVTTGSFDSFMWQTLETKARFIAQVMKAETAIRRADDIGSQELSYAEVKAIASGNPAILTLAEADAELSRLSLLKKNHLDEQYVARLSVRDLPKRIADLSERRAQLGADLATLTAHADDAITIGDTACSRDEAVSVLADYLETLLRGSGQRRRLPLGTYRGLRFGMATDPQWAPDVYLQGETVRQSGLMREHQGPRAILNAVERLSGTYAAEVARAEQELQIAESQLRDYQSRLGKPFPHETYLAQLTDLRDRLKARLSVTAAAEGSESESTAAELAEGIRSLTAGNAIAAVPHREGTPRPSAAEAVTAVIRRRLQSGV